MQRKNSRAYLFFLLLFNIPVLFSAPNFQNKEAHEEALSIKRLQECDDEKPIIYFCVLENSDSKEIFAAPQNPSAEYRDNNDTSHVPKLSIQLLRDGVYEKIAALSAYSRLLHNTKSILRRAQQRPTIEITPNGAVGVSTPDSPNKNHVGHNQTPLNFSAHFGVASNADSALILETVLEAIKGTGVELTPVVAPVIVLAKATALTHALVKHGPAIAFNSLKTTLKDSFSGPNTSSRSYRYKKSLVDAQQNYIKNNPDARYITIIEEFNGTLVESTYLASCIEELDSLHHVDYAPINLSEYGEIPSVGRIVKVTSQRPLIFGFDKPSAFQAEQQKNSTKLIQAKAPCGGNALPARPATGCGQAKPQKNKPRLGCAGNLDRNKKKIPVGRPKVKQVKKHAGCGERPKQNKGDGVLGASSNSGTQSSEKTRKSKPSDKRKPISAELKQPAKPAIEWTPHDYKHVPKSQPWEQTVQETQYGDAKYKTYDLREIEKIERAAWELGITCSNGKTWKVMKFGRIIGAKKGIETSCIRIEMSANTIHGHPITPAEYQKYIKQTK